jgi:hypothetical protein
VGRDAFAARATMDQSAQGWTGLHASITRLRLRRRYRTADPCLTNVGGDTFHGACFSPEIFRVPHAVLVYTFFGAECLVERTKYSEKERTRTVTFLETVLEFIVEEITSPRLTLSPSVGKPGPDGFVDPDKQPLAN